MHRAHTHIGVKTIRTVCATNSRFYCSHGRHIYSCCRGLYWRWYCSSPSNLHKITPTADNDTKADVIPVLVRARWSDQMIMEVCARARRQTQIQRVYCNREMNAKQLSVCFALTHMNSIVIAVHTQGGSRAPTHQHNHHRNIQKKNAKNICSSAQTILRRLLLNRLFIPQYWIFFY